jgi:hypothetical protein
MFWSTLPKHQIFSIAPVESGLQPQIKRWNRRKFLLASHGG